MALVTTMTVLSVEEARAMGLPWVDDSLDHRFMRVWHGTYGDTIARLIEERDSKGLRLMSKLHHVSWALFQHGAQRVQGGALGEQAKPREHGRMQDS